jgi:hypothetical protein
MMFLASEAPWAFWLRQRWRFRALQAVGVEQRMTAGGRIQGRCSKYKELNRRENVRPVTNSNNKLSSLKEEEFRSRQAEDRVVMIIVIVAVVVFLCGALGVTILLTLKEPPPPPPPVPRPRRQGRRELSNPCR